MAAHGHPPGRTVCPAAQPKLQQPPERHTAGPHAPRDVRRLAPIVSPSRSVSALLPPRPLSAQLPPRCPASFTPMWPLRLALPFPPARKTNGGRLRPAGCPPPSPARPSLPSCLRLSRSALPVTPPAPQSDRHTAGSPAPVRALPPLAAPTAPLALVAAPPVPLGPLHLPTERQAAGACVPQDACRLLALLRAPFAALSLSPRFGHCALAWSLPTERQTAGARAPLGALPPSPARPCRCAPPRKGGLDLAQICPLRALRFALRPLKQGDQYHNTRNQRNPLKTALLASSTDLLARLFSGPESPTAGAPLSGPPAALLLLPPPCSVLSVLALVVLDYLHVQPQPYQDPEGLEHLPDLHPVVLLNRQHASLHKSNFSTPLQAAWTPCAKLKIGRC